MYICISYTDSAENLKTSWKPAKYRSYLWHHLEGADPVPDSLVTTVGGSLLHSGELVTSIPSCFGAREPGLVFPLAEPWLPLPLKLPGRMAGRHHYPLWTKWVPPTPVCICCPWSRDDAKIIQLISVNLLPHPHARTKLGAQIWFFLLKANKPIIKSKQGGVALKQLTKSPLAQSPKFTLLSQTTAPP